jgi:hypothetical protein
MKKKGIVHIFSGKVFCMECKHYMRKKNSSKHEYLVCLDSEYDKCKNKKGIRYDTLENIILNEINKKIKKYYDKELIEKEINKKKLATNKVRDLEKQKLELEKKIDKNRIYLKNLYEDKINKNITNTEFNDLVSTYNKEKDLLNKKITTLNCEINNCKKKENFSDLLEKYQKLTSLNKIIVDEFINKIYIGNLNINDNRRNIQIKWNF